jgi:hypothetical protein
MLATIDPKDSRTIALSTNPWGRAGGAVFVSRDDASHWTNVTGDLPNGTGMAAICFSRTESVLWPAVQRRQRLQASV